MAASFATNRGRPGPNPRAWTRWLIVLAPGIAIILHEAVFETLAGGTWESWSLSWNDLGRLAAFAGLVVPISWVVLQLVEHLEQEVATQHEELARLHATIAERERLSREIHDGSAQVLAFLLMSIDTVLGLIRAGRNESACLELERMRAGADEAYRDTREAIVSLRTELDGRSLTAALHDLCEQFEDRTGLTVQLEVDPAAERLAPIAQLQAVRIVREALTNVRKHANATQIQVTLKFTGQSVLTSISDNGRGLAAAPESSGGRHLGVQTMRERAESVGGWLGITSLPGAGVTVVAELPIITLREEDGVTNPVPAR